MQVAVHNFFCNDFLFPLIFPLLDRAVDLHSFLRIRIQLFFSMRIRIQLLLNAVSDPFFCYFSIFSWRFNECGSGSTALLNALNVKLICLHQ